MDWLKANLNYTSDELELIRYGFLSIIMETSKFILMVIFFTIIGKTKEFLFGTFILLLLRSNTGGLHLSTYWGCLLFSTLLLYTGCVWLPYKWHIPNTGMHFLLAECILVTWKTGPVVSPKRPQPTALQAKKSKKTACTFISLYLITVFLLSENSYIRIGFWIIILQTVQLVISYFLRKEKVNEKKIY